MRPAPPRGAVLAQLWLAWAEFQDDSVPEVSPPGPRPSEWPTCAARLSDADVQSLHVMPRMSVPSAFDPVRMSCSTGGGDPSHWPGMRWPCSATHTFASPFLACSSVTPPATRIPLAFTHGPPPIRLRASVGLLSRSRSTLK